MKSLLLRFVLAAACFLPLAVPAVYVYNTINYPGAVNTDTRGITNTGRIVGYVSVPDGSKVRVRFKAERCRGLAN